ncbi:MAG: hypothetical protein Q9163_001341 [Psora crenata]
MGRTNIIPIAFLSVVAPAGGGSSCLGDYMNFEAGDHHGVGREWIARLGMVARTGSHPHGSVGARLQNHSWDHVELDILLTCHKRRTHDRVPLADVWSSHILVVSRPEGPVWVARWKHSVVFQEDDSVVAE